MTKGFVTLAVGKDHYYKLANNLLTSYKASAYGETLPWTLVCDRENAYTSDFDSVILLDNPSFSYMDKLKVFEFCPYDECIFIDADCLVFQDLSPIWQHMKNVNGFSCFGVALPLDSQNGWFLQKDVGEWNDRISFIPQMHGGICLMKRGQKLNEILQLSTYIAEHYSDYKFKYFKKPADEPILALAMAIADSKPIPSKPEYFAFLPTVDKICINSYIHAQNHIYVESSGISQEVYIIHFQNHNTDKAPYKVVFKVLTKHLKCLAYPLWLVYLIEDLLRPWYNRARKFMKILSFSHLS